jgi:RimJ/RimL family protein N-acetyltransferase
MAHLFDLERDYILENDYCKLVPLQELHYEVLVNFAIQEPELWRFSLQHAGSPEGMRKYIADALAQRQSGKGYPFLVYDKVQHAYAGCTRVYDIDQFNKNISIGYTWYGKMFQGTGLNKHCKYLLFQFIFEQLGFERVEFRLDSQNERSMHAIKSLGCTFEGVLRSNGYKVDGTRRDSAVLSILKQEWLGGAKENLYRKLRQ